MTVEDVFLQVLRFSPASIITPVLHTQIYLILPLSGRQAGKARELSNNKNTFIVCSSAFQKLRKDITQVTTAHIQTERPVRVTVAVARIHALTSNHNTLGTCFILCIFAESETRMPASACSSLVYTVTALRILITSTN